MGAGASAQDFMVQQRIAGASMTVEITMPAGGGALVQGDTISGQGLYYVPVHSANFTEVIGANASGNPRVDQVILEVLDNVHDASGSNLARIRVLAGTATSGATLDNRSGAATLPGSALLLADVLVANGAATITNTVIRDRRKWARGAQGFVLRTSGDVSTGGTGAAIDSTGMAPRIECSGVPLMMGVVSLMVGNSANMDGYTFFQLDGSTLAGSQRGGWATAIGNSIPVSNHYMVSPTAASHVLVPFFGRTASGTITIAGNTNNGTTFYWREVVSQSTANNTTTSG